MGTYHYNFTFSFVRSITMDKWKDLELEKMKVGGNRKAKDFLSTQDDWDEDQSLQERYNSRAAALYRDKVMDGQDSGMLLRIHSNILAQHVISSVNPVTGHGWLIQGHRPAWKNIVCIINNRPYDVTFCNYCAQMWFSVKQQDRDVQICTIFNVSGCVLYCKMKSFST